MQPLRINLITCNIWNTERWNARAATLKRFLELYSPDMLCLQELRQKTRIFLDKALPGHSRVQDSFAGWAAESNIYWRDTMFSEIEHGAEDVKIREKGHRALFWARLGIRDRERSMLVANGEAKPIATSVPNFLLNDSAPSDHWPVQAIYELKDER